ncbi:MAG: dicarboxylate/amino acid:cation symporter [Holosporales bacterium]|jgi:Na+/H+-dicarboxylate symporter|nr:dicarboxylate/amino acid:cation symporter [Holosporales bacterium]
MGFFGVLKTPVIFPVALVVSVVFGPIIPFQLKALLYTVSLIIKEHLVLLLPFVVFSLIFSSIVKFGTKALKYVAIIIPLICFSNFTNTILSYFASLCVKVKTPNIINECHKLSPLFNPDIPKIISNDTALVCGVLLGLILSFLNKDFASKLSTKLEKFTGFFFKILVPMMPLFIIGTILKLQHDKILSSIYKQYLPVLLMFVAVAFGLVFTQLLLLANFKITKALSYLKNIFPALITAFGSMSSAAALPLSIKAAEKNIEEKTNAGIIIPATVNIHLVGDCFFIPMIAIAAMGSFGMELPTICQYTVFALHFVLTKFAVAAIPGGGILVMLPVMQKYLGVSSDMLALVTAIYILFDPLITACNVCGNSAMAIIFDRITKTFKKKII